MHVHECTCACMSGQICVFILHVSVSVCTQHRSETGWTTAAVEGTGKESGGKGVTAACRPPDPLPLTTGCNKTPCRQFHTHTHTTLMHTYKQGDHNDKVQSWPLLWVFWPPLVNCHAAAKMTRRILGLDLQSDGCGLKWIWIRLLICAGY